MTECLIKTYIIKRNPGGPELPRRIWRLSLGDRESEAKHVSSKLSGRHRRRDHHAAAGAAPLPRQVLLFRLLHGRSAVRALPAEGHRLAGGSDPRKVEQAARPQGWRTGYGEGRYGGWRPH